MPFKCRVCGRFIRGVYNHYGGQSCSACAAFFIRAVNKKRKYVCANLNLCLAIPSRTGTKCGKCRFKKCLEIGMNSPTLEQNKTEATKDLGKYLILSKELYGLLTVITKDPQQILNYYNPSGNSTLNEDGSKVAKTLEPTQLIRNWAKMFKNNQIPINEIYLLFYGIISTIKFPWIPFEKQKEITSVQQEAVFQFLQPSAYSSPEVKEGFDKLTVFFQKQYTQLFSLKKLKENGQFDQIFSDVLTLDS